MPSELVHSRGTTHTSPTKRMRRHFIVQRRISRIATQTRNAEEFVDAIVVGL